MRLQTRLTVSAATLITSVSLVVGGISVYGSFGRQIDDLKSDLNTAASQISLHKSQALSVALLIGEQENLAVGLVDVNRHYTSLNQGNLQIKRPPALKALKLAEKTAVLRTNPPKHYVLRTVRLPNEEWVLLATSYQQPLEQFRANQIWLLLFTAVADLVAVLLTWLLMRRDLHAFRMLVNRARGIAAGKDSNFTAEENVTEVTELGEALTSMVSQLQAHQVEMQRFLGDASHELRTPLTVIRGYLELIAGMDLAKLGDREFAMNALPKLQAQTQRMQTLIDDLLLLAELGEPGKARNFETLDLSTMVADQSTDLANLNPERTVSAEIEPAVMISGDSMLLGHLLANLFGNIRRHTASNVAVSVNLTTGHSRYDRSHVARLTLDDAGEGLAPDAYERGIAFFERFDTARNRENGGSGLGMSIMAGVVAKHGGRVHLSASPLGGLRTEIELPLAKA
jgi:two-component system OmpR family sensor kinase